MAYRMPEEQQQALVTDALASIKFYRNHYASTVKAADHTRQIVKMLLEAGQHYNTGKYGCLLTNAAEMISRTYLNMSLEELANEKPRAA